MLNIRILICDFKVVAILTTITYIHKMGNATV